MHLSVLIALAGLALAGCASSQVTLWPAGLNAEDPFSHPQPGGQFSEALDLEPRDRDWIFSASTAELAGWIRPDAAPRIATHDVAYAMPGGAGPHVTFYEPFEAVAGVCRQTRTSALTAPDFAGDARRVRPARLFGSVWYQADVRGCDTANLRSGFTAPDEAWTARAVAMYRAARTRAERGRLVVDCDETIDCRALFLGLDVRRLSGVGACIGIDGCMTYQIGPDESGDPRWGWGVRIEGGDQAPERVVVSQLPPPPPA